MALAISFDGLAPSSVKSSVKSAVMCPAGMVEPTMIEIGGVVSVKERAIVFKINPITIVPIPYGVIIISVAGEVSFDDVRSCIIATCIDRGRSIDNGCRYGGSYINPGGWNAETDTGSDEYLSITFCSDEAGGYNGGEDK